MSYLPNELSETYNDYKAGKLEYRLFRYSLVDLSQGKLYKYQYDTLCNSFSEDYVKTKDFETQINLYNGYCVSTPDSIIKDNLIREKALIDEKKTQSKGMYSRIIF